MSTERFIERLTRGPAVLFLGQKYLARESGVDEFLFQLRRKYGDGSAGRGYWDLFGFQALQLDRESALAWMYELAERITVPPWLSLVAGFPWNTVCSSAVESTWERPFRTEWRRTQPVLSDQYEYVDHRSRSRLHCCYLFGRLGESEPNTRIPGNKFEHGTRQAVADALLRRTIDLLTPLGTLVMEGYDGKEDWFEESRLAPLLAALDKGQVHVFGCDPDCPPFDYDSPPVEEGVIVQHGESLASVLKRGERRGSLALGQPEVEGGLTAQISDGKVQRTVPSDIWDSVARFGEILTDVVLAPPARVSEPALELMFREFLSAPADTPDWSWYARGFPFRRPFEEDLDRAVGKALRSGSRRRKRLVLLHGQTGTGKTIALNALAYRIRSERRLPVLLVHRRSSMPSTRAIGAFCGWADEAGFRDSVLVWDGMRRPRQYVQLMRDLESLGRRPLIVGSYYDDRDVAAEWAPTETTGQEEGAGGKDPAESEEGANVREDLIPVEVDPDLSDQELQGLEEHLATYGIQLTDRTRDTLRREASCLSALYRLIPPARSRIRSGVVDEVRESEKQLRRILGSLQLEGDTKRLMAEAMVRSGLIMESDVSRESEEPGTAESVEAIALARELTGLIMVPGQHGLSVPIDLLLRATSGRLRQELTRILEEFDIFRVHEDPPRSGNYLISPRNQMEAQLLVTARFGGPSSEIEFATALLKRVRRYAGRGDGEEVDFAVELMRELGPNNERYGRRYRDYWPLLADAARVVRERSGLENSRILLQEAHLRREWIKECGERAGPTKVAQALDLALEAMKLAEKLAGEEGRSRSLKGYIQVELAALHGTWAHTLLREGRDGRDFSRHLESVIECTSKARAIDPTSYIPIDVLAWNAKAAIKADVLGEKESAELMASVLSAFDSVEPETLPRGMASDYHKRRVQMGLLLKDSRLTSDALSKLEEIGSTAGIYIVARDLAGDLPHSRPVSDRERERIHAALEYLGQHRDRYEDDSRCRYLELKLWWLVHAGAPFFYAERQAIAFSSEEWGTCFSMLEPLLSPEFELQGIPRPTIMYLAGIALFHLERFDESFEIFSELGDDPELVRGLSRLISYFTFSTPDGSPRVFDGTVAWIEGDGKKGRIEVSEIRRSIRFVSRSFVLATDLRKHDRISDFHIVFNHLGPLAEPAHASGKGKR